MVKLQYTGRESTLIRPQEGAEKVEMKPKQIIEMPESLAQQYVKYSDKFVIVTADIKKEKIEKAEPKKEDVDAPKVEPKKV
jgi:hypothetical protein